MSKYDDLMNLPYEKSKTHPHMSNHDRAAQFAPFAALTGYGEAISETGRLTEQAIELSDEEKEELNRKFQKIQTHLNEEPRIEVTYFVFDRYKSGGKYITEEVQVTKIDTISRFMTTKEKKKIDLDEIIWVEIKDESHV